MIGRLNGRTRIEARSTMSENQYYYSNHGQRFGPVSSRHLRALAASGQLLPSDTIWRAGRPKGVPASEIPGLFATPPQPLTPNVQCPHCHQQLALSQLVPGHRYECPFCQQAFSLPMAVAAPPSVGPQATAPAAPLLPTAPQEHVYRFGLAHKARETFQHSFGGAFGISMGWLLGRFVASLLIGIVTIGGCVGLGWIASRSAESSLSGDQHEERRGEPPTSANAIPQAVSIRQGELTTDAILSGLSWQQYVYDCGVAAQRENAARAKHLFQTRYRNQAVQWSGRVQSVRHDASSTGFKVYVKMSPSEAKSSGYDLALHLPARCHADGVLELRKGDEIRFVAIVRQQGDSILWHEVDFLSMLPPLPAEPPIRPLVIGQVSVEDVSHDLLDVSWANYLRDCGAAAQLVDQAAARNRFEGQYQGQAIRWAARLSQAEIKTKSVLGSRVHLVGMQMQPSEGRDNLPDLYLQVADEDLQEFLQMAPGSRIEFTGLLLELGTEQQPHVVKLLQRQ